MLQEHDLIIHIGAGFCHDLDKYVSSEPKEIILIDANSQISERLKYKASQFSNVTVLNKLITADGGICQFYQYSVNKFSGIYPADKLFESYPNLELVSDNNVVSTSILEVFQQYISKYQSVMLVVDIYGQSGNIINELSKHNIYGVVKTIKIIDFYEQMYSGGVLSNYEQLAQIGFYPQVVDDSDPGIGSVMFELNPLFIILKAQQNENLKLQAELKTQTELAKNQEILLQTVNQQFKKLGNHLTRQTKLEANNVIKQIESYHYLQSFFKESSFILDFHGWPVSADFGVLLVRLLQKKHYDLVIEFGSGSSTVLMGKAIKQIYQRQKIKPFVISFDHLEQYATQTKEMLVVANVADVAKVYLASLSSYDGLIGQDSLYYDQESIIEALQSYKSSRELSILVVVDGPPESTCNLARYPALPILKNVFNHAKMDILMDDADRAGEQQIIALWESLLSSCNNKYTITKFDVEKGACLISTAFSS